MPPTDPFVPSLASLSSPTLTADLESGRSLNVVGVETVLGAMLGHRRANTLPASEGELPGDGIRDEPDDDSRTPR